MLPQPILDEFFNPQYLVSEQAKEYIAEELAKHGFTVQNIVDLDSVVYYYSNIDHAQLELRVDRVVKRFEICAKVDAVTILPTAGDWSVIEEYLLCCQELVVSKTQS